MNEQTETKIVNYMNLKIMLPDSMTSSGSEELLKQIMNVLQGGRVENNIEVVHTYSNETAPLRIV